MEELGRKSRQRTFNAVVQLPMIMMHSEKSAKLKVPERDGNRAIEKERYRQSKK